MSLSIEYHDLVDLDLSNAWNWYENQEQGLGDRFLNAIHATVVQAARWPNAGQPILRNDQDEIIERKVPANGFPYAVRYRALGDRLLVMAVLHQSRRPNLGADRQP